MRDYLTFALFTSAFHLLLPFAIFFMLAFSFFHESGKMRIRAASGAQRPDVARR